MNKQYILEVRQVHEQEIIQLLTDPAHDEANIGIVYDDDKNRALVPLYDEGSYEISLPEMLDCMAADRVNKIIVFRYGLYLGVLGVHDDLV
jgi:hypothetical protein